VANSSHFWFDVTTMKFTEIASRALRIKNVPAITILVLGAFAGCDPSPPPPKSGIEIKAPGVDIQIDKSGTDVKAPGADVKVDAKRG